MRDHRVLAQSLRGSGQWRSGHWERERERERAVGAEDGLAAARETRRSQGRGIHARMAKKGVESHKLSGSSSPRNGGDETKAHDEALKASQVGDVKVLKQLLDAGGGDSHSSGNGETGENDS